MKKIILFVGLLYGMFAHASSVITDSAFVYQQILNGIQNASYIFEGEVVYSKSYYNEAHNYIYTSNIVQVFQVWKSGEIVTLNKGEYVEVVTRGGTVGTRTLSISHNAEFVKGQKGMFLCKPVVYETDPNSSVSSAFQFQLEDGLYFDYDYSKHYISTSIGDINFECIESLYEIIDPNYVADCLGVFPNGVLQEQRYNDFLQISNQKAANVIADNGTIVYTFENARTTHKNGTATFEFDIFISASANNPVYLDNAHIKLYYNFLAFGDSIVSRNKITVQRGEVLASITDYNDPSIYDAGFSVLAIGMSITNNPQNRALIDFNPKRLVHVKMEVQNCNKLPDIEFTDVSSMKNFTFYTSNPNTPAIGPFKQISYINATDTEDSDLCLMNIDDFNPKTVAGGVGDVITINGHFFGSTKGVVAFRNANTGGQTLITVDDYDIVTWNDSVIEVRVPSTVPITATSVSQLQIPGSGKIIVQQDLGLDIFETLDEIQIEYSWRNYFIYNYKKGKVHLAGVDSVYDEDGIHQNLGYSFILNPNISVNAKRCIEKALHDWTCATEVRWQIDAQTGVWPDVEDRVSMMRMGQIQQSTVLAETSAWWEICSGPGGEELSFIDDIDITFKNINSWFYDSTGTIDQPAGKYDFYAVALHELGHAHLLNHVNQQDDIMWYGSLQDFQNPIVWWRRKIFFEPINISAGSDIIAQSQQVDYSYCSDNDYPMFPLPKSFCSVPMSDQRFSVGVSSVNLRVIPNPFITQPILEVLVPNETEANLQIFDATGKLIENQNNIRLTTGKNEILLNQIKHSGIFMGVLTIYGERHSFKLIKQ
ncbi:T9SS type A sorting domain-containing protein [bacterium SCSIO 12643]|nr:T9SS type A sorting domain-containing protein [bacterium SCSIO 12643]